MNQEIDEFLEALKEKSNSKMLEIESTVDPSILEIQNQTLLKINQIEAEFDSFKNSPVLMDSFQRTISEKQEDWLRRSNNEKGRLMDQIILKLKDKFKTLAIGTESYNLLNKMFQEIKQDSGNTYEVHITQNCDPDKFKTISGTNQHVIADLDRVGVLVKRLDSPITIENTLESRFIKKKEDLIIKASQDLWNDLDESPWQFQKVMGQLRTKK
ncbi:hypothetical protein [Candidatus Hodarchaeum mangrovi]